jgi:hypothetical protein
MVITRNSGSCLKHETMQADPSGEDATGRSAVLGSETRKSLPPVPPSPPPPAKKGYVAVMAVAIATGILVVGSLMLFVGTAPADTEPEVAADADALESGTAPSPTMVTTPSVGTSPSPVSDPGRISAIVADAHSGKYFSNKFEDSYPKAVEIALVKGMIRATDGNPNVTDGALACALSYIETHLSSMELIKKGPKSTERIGVKAGFACLDYYL